MHNRPEGLLPEGIMHDGPEVTTEGIIGKSMDVLTDVRRLFDDKVPEDQQKALVHVLRDKMKKDLHFFAYHCCGYHDIVNPLHRGMCDRWMARLTHPFSLWLVPRKHLKTSLWTVAGTLWELVNDPELTFCISNAKYDIAEKILDEMKVIRDTNEIFRLLFPEYTRDISPYSKDRVRRAKDRNDRLDFPCSSHAGRKIGNIEIVSAGGGQVSQHYKRFIHDDIVNDENTTTKAYRDKIWDWLRNSLQLRFDLTSPVKVIGTRWHFDDAYARIVKQEQERRDEQEREGLPINPRWLILKRQIIEDKLPIWPQRYGLEAIMNLKEDVGSYIFSCQFMNDPLPEEDAIFKRKDICLIDDLEIPQNVANFMAVDLAVNEDQSIMSDWSVISVASFDVEGKMYVVDIFRDKISVLDAIEVIYKMCARWNVIRVGMETQVFQKVVLNYYKRESAKRGWNIPWHEMEGKTNTKRKRAYGFQPRVERGDFHIVAKLKHAEQALEEMTTFPLGAHDDVLDTFIYLEQLFFAAPRAVEKKKDPGLTYDAVYGSIFEDDEEEGVPESSLIGKHGVF